MSRVSRGEAREDGESGFFGVELKMSSDGVWKFMLFRLCPESREDLR